jgi:protein-tyrosine sulfotransferase
VKSPIFLLGCHKSGSSLLRSLFDGHPQLDVLPIETHFMLHLKYKCLYPFAKYNFFDGDVVQSIIRMIEHYNRSENWYADTMLPGLFSIEKIRAVLSSRFNDFTSYLETYFGGIFASLDTSTNSGRFVEKSVENFEYAAFIRALIPNSQFVHILRNPYDNLCSLRRYLGKNEYPSIVEPLMAIAYSYHFAKKNMNLGNYHIIRYEDLIQEPEAIMRKLAKELSLDWNEILLKPTSLGKAWRGNSTTNVAFEGVNDRSHRASNFPLEPIEVYYVNKALGAVLEDFGYPKIGNRGFWKPARNEKLKTYFRNRMFRLYYSVVP